MSDIETALRREHTQKRVQSIDSVALNEAEQMLNSARSDMLDVKTQRIVSALRSGVPAASMDKEIVGVLGAIKKECAERVALREQNEPQTREQMKARIRARLAQISAG